MSLKEGIYQALSLNDDTLEGLQHRFNLLSRRQRLRLHVGGILFIGLGMYIMWKALMAVVWLFPHASTPHLWRDTQYMFVFGDSYSSVGYDVHGGHPNATNIFGNPPFPGDTTAGGPNWVGYLATEFAETPKLVHDFAVYGDTVQGVERQVREEFLPYAGQHPSWAPWSSESSLFFTWVGINDGGHGLDPVTQLTLLFNLEEDLYTVGARHFVFFTVPPFERVPQIINANPESRKERIVAWNTELLKFIAAFQRRHQDIYTYLYDSAPVFNAILDEPTRFGFKDAISECLQEDCIWWDEAHPAFGLHRILAQDIALFLDKL